MPTRADTIDTDFDTNIDIGIRWRIAKPSTGCKDKLGLCDPKVFGPGAGSYTRTVCNSNSSKYECLSLVHKDTEGNLFIEIELKVNPSEIGIIQVPCFCVEEEIFQPNEDCLDSVVHILPGTFEYKQNIGVNGGYKIPLAYEAKTY